MITLVYQLRLNPHHPFKTLLYHFKQYTHVQLAKSCWETPVPFTDPTVPKKLLALITNYISQDSLGKPCLLKLYTGTLNVWCSCGLTHPISARISVCDFPPLLSPLMLSPDLLWRVGRTPRTDFGDTQGEGWSCIAQADSLALMEGVSRIPLSLSSFYEGSSLPPPQYLHNGHELCDTEKVSWC